MAVPLEQAVADLELVTARSVGTQCVILFANQGTLVRSVVGADADSSSNVDNDIPTQIGDR